MPELTPRVVFDCNLFVQGIANRNSPARKALRLFFNGDISLFVSEPIIREVRDVLNRANVRRQLPGINDRIVNAFLTKLEARQSGLLTIQYPLQTTTNTAQGLTFLFARQRSFVAKPYKITDHASTNYHGARASNACDDLYELSALSPALVALEYSTQLALLVFPFDLKMTMRAQ